MKIQYLENFNILEKKIITLQNKIQLSKTLVLKLKKIVTMNYLSSLKIVKIQDLIFHIMSHSPLQNNAQFKKINFIVMKYLNKEKFLT